MMRGPAVRYFPVFIDLDGAKVVVSGAGGVAVAKLRLLLKTPAQISVFGTAPEAQIGIGWSGWPPAFLTRHHPRLKI